MTPSLIVGLGNPGRRYDHTRHNLGFRVLDGLTDQNQGWSPWKKEGDVLVCQTAQTGHKIFVIKPQTFMNDSGAAVARFIKFYKIPLNQVWVVHDDVDLPFGELRQAFDRGSAGHQGVESIISHLGGQAFHRLRIGISSNRPRGIPSEDYVLQNFSNEEEETLTTHIIPQAVEHLRARERKLVKTE